MVGLGATMIVGSDRYPYTVVAFNKTGKTISVVPDKFAADVAGGHDYYGTQKYLFSPGNPINVELPAGQRNGAATRFKAPVCGSANARRIRTRASRLPK